ncbi:MAG: flagellar brake protein [Fervidobacterium sp.]|jgi:c-di-GMP-binding flagellar brake protein YcgR
MPYVELVDASKALRIGLPAQIIISLVKELEGVYKSNVIDIDLDKNIIFLSIPSLKGKFVPIPKGVRMTINVFDRSSVYEFQTVSLGVTKKDNIYSIPAPFPEVIRKTERRKFVRVPLFLDGRFYISNEPDAESYPFTTKNISAGGLLIATKKLLKLGDIIYIDLKLTEDFSLEKQKSRIVREDGKIDDYYMYGIQFLDVQTNVEKNLVKFIFQQELKQRNIQSSIKK